MMLLTHRPGPPLTSCVEALWYYDGFQTAAHHKERVLPNGRFQIVIDLSAGSGAVAGLQSQCFVIKPAAIQSVMGIIFRPGGARGFVEGPADDFYNRVVPLDAVWGSQATELRDRLGDAVTVGSKFQVLETALLQGMRRTAARLALHPSVQYALREFRHVAHIKTVIDISREAGLSRRRFSELFREQVGMTPKLYCRLIRFRAVVRQIATGAQVEWTDVAVAGGYYDQAHLTHEFRDFSGMSPGRYLAAERPSINHVRID